MTMPPSRPLQVLFLCTGNSARSQIAEAVLNHLGRGRFVAESAGSHPAARVNPFAITALREAGIEWAGHPPHGLEEIHGRTWDVVITVCDNAKEACPILPGQPVQAHWGMPDPAEVQGDEKRKRAAFSETLTLLARRIGLLLALPAEQLQGSTLRDRLNAIGEASVEHPSAPCR